MVCCLDFLKVHNDEKVNNNGTSSSNISCFMEKYSYEKVRAHLAPLIMFIRVKTDGLFEVLFSVKFQATEIENVQIRIL